MKLSNLLESILKLMPQLREDNCQAVEYVLTYSLLLSTHN